MQSSSVDDLNSVLISESAKENSKEYERGNSRVRRRIEQDFFYRSVDYRAFILSPGGYEGVALAFYAASLPYFAGLLFLFFFVAQAQVEFFIGFDLSDFFVIWAIGYEVCAGSVLIGIFIGWLKYLSDRWNKEQERKKSVF